MRKVVGFIAAVMLFGACGSSTSTTAPTSATAGGTAAPTTAAAPRDPVEFAASVCRSIRNGGGDLNTATQLGLCGLSIDAFDGGWTVTIAGSSAPTGLADAFLAFGTKSGCYDEADIQRMVKTRALDGMVSSTNRRSTWTYHPDNGLQVVCNAK